MRTTSSSSTIPIAFLLPWTLALGAFPGCQVAGPVLESPDAASSTSTDAAADTAIPNGDAATDVAVPEEAGFTDSGHLEGDACSAAPVITPDPYDKSCQVDSDCVDVPLGGSTCDRCKFDCAATALSQAGAARYRSDYTAALATYSTAQEVCGGACIQPPTTCCVAGSCHAGSFCAGDAEPVDARPVDAAPDADLCSSAPVITPDAYDKSCKVDSDCVDVPSGGNVCDDNSHLPFCCVGAPLSQAGAARFLSDFTAARAAYHHSPAVCSVACNLPPAACCVAGTCRGGSACVADAGPDCGAPPQVTNDARCPATYPGVAAQCTPCTTIGLSCAYPGRGDGTPQGCPSTAVLQCVSADAGIGGCAADGGAGYWVVAQ